MAENKNYMFSVYSDAIRTTTSSVFVLFKTAALSHSQALYACLRVDVCVSSVCSIQTISRFLFLK